MYRSAAEKPHSSPPTPGAARMRDTARKILRLRHARDRLLGTGLFGEPAWNILLDLYIAGVDGKTASVSSASLASGAPATTGLRYIELLAREGLVMRERAEQDRRMTMVSLTERGRNAIEQLLTDYIA